MTTPLQPPLRCVFTNQNCKLMNIIFFVLSLCCLFTNFAFAEMSQQDQINSQQFYRIKEGTKDDASMDPVGVFRMMITELGEKILSLLHLEFHVEIVPPPPSPYNRVGDFGRWINDPTDNDCYNTRGKVLARDAEEPVVVDRQRGCTIKKGLWHDKYSAQNIEWANQLQIDHTVPLKHAWTQGASAWSYEMRCLYANFLGNKFHLIPVSAHENMSKGDRGPDQYLPPVLQTRCEYIRNWLAIKLIWQLRISPQEKAAIDEQVKINQCDPQMFQMGQVELAQQRGLIEKWRGLCKKPTPRGDRLSELGNAPAFPISFPNGPDESLPPIGSGFDLE